MGSDHHAPYQKAKIETMIATTMAIVQGLVNTAAIVDKNFFITYEVLNGEYPANTRLTQKIIHTVYASLAR